MMFSVIDFVSFWSTHGYQPEPVTSAESSGKVLTRRGRLVKPKPNLGQNSRSKQIQNTAQTDKGLWGKRLTLSFYCSGMVFDIFCWSPDSGGSDVQVSKGRPIGGAVEQKTVKNPTANTDVPSEVSDHLDQPRDDIDVAGSSFGCITELTSYTQVRFRAAATCSMLEVKWFQEGFLIFVLGFSHILWSWRSNSSRFHHIFWE